MTSLEGRVLRRRRAVEPPAGVRDELWILSELARRLDAPGRYDLDAEAVFDELCRASAGGPADYSGIDYALLDSGAAVHWPYPVGSTGTPRLFLDRFAHDDGRAWLVSVKPVTPPGPAAVDGALTLITGRLLEHYQSGTQTRRVPELAEQRPQSEAQLHPVAAERLGLADGDLAELTSPSGRVRAIVRLSPDIRHDTVFLPFHYPDSESANLVTRPDTDPISGMPEFKRTVVQMRRVEAPNVEVPIMEVRDA